MREQAITLCLLTSSITSFFLESFIQLLQNIFCVRSILKEAEADDKEILKIVLTSK